MQSYTTILLSLLGGILPTLFWLWFWLKEDRLHPEPRGRIILTFLAGMISVLLVLPIEKYVFNSMLMTISTLTIFMWATIEELFKFVAAYITSLSWKTTDEPIDSVIYMITAALGFSALENALFISNLINESFFYQSVVTGNSRFIGATLLHLASSAAIGVMMGLSFYKKPWIKSLFLLTGVALSIILHTIFNLLIIKLNNDIFLVFSGVWILIILLIVLIEKVKSVRVS